MHHVDSIGVGNGAHSLQVNATGACLVHISVSDEEGNENTASIRITSPALPLVYNMGLSRSTNSLGAEKRTFQLVYDVTYPAPERFFTHNLPSVSARNSTAGSCSVAPRANIRYRFLGSERGGSFHETQFTAVSYDVTYNGKDGVENHCILDDIRIFAGGLPTKPFPLNGVEVRFTR